MGNFPLDHLLSNHFSSIFYILVLRKDVEGAPSEANGEGNALSSPTTQIAKQNRTAEEPEWAERSRTGVHSAFEDTIWQSEVRRKVVAGGAPLDAPSDMS